MTTENTATNTAASNETGERKEWPQRFGTMTRLEVKSGRKGEYGIMTVDCGGKFTQVAFVFSAKILAKVQEAASKAHAAGTQATVWFKGPIESIDRGGFSKDEMKVVYFSDNTQYDTDAPEAEEEAAAKAEPDDLTAIKGIGEAVAKVLNENDIETYAGLAAQTPEALDEMSKGYAARASKYNWLGQAQELSEKAAEAAEANAKSKAKLDEEIPF